MREDGGGPAAAQAMAAQPRVEIIPHYETFRTTIQPPYSSTKGYLLDAGDGGAAEGEGDLPDAGRRVADGAPRSARRTDRVLSFL